MKSLERLVDIKVENKKNSSEKMIFLLNPKDTKILEALIAWQSIKVSFNEEAEVDENATIEQLWELSNFNLREYAITLGCPSSEAIPRLKQLKNLNLVYPDGSVNETAQVLVRMYIKKRLSEVKDVKGETDE